MTKIEWTEKSWQPIVGCTKVRNIVSQCKSAGVPVFVKQIHKAKKPYGFKLFKDINQFPKDLQIREYPNQTRKATIGDSLE